MLKVTKNRLLVKVKVEEETSTGGIIISAPQGRYKEGIERGEVIIVGEQEELQVKVGDLVYFAKYAGQIIYDPEKSIMYRVLNDVDVCLIGDIKELC